MSARVEVTVNGKVVWAYEYVKPREASLNNWRWGNAPVKMTNAVAAELNRVARASSDRAANG